LASWRLCCGQLDVAARVTGREGEEAFLSVISASELLHGAHRATDPAFRARRLAFAEAILARFPVLEIDLEVARAHAALWSDLAQRGDPQTSRVFPRAARAYLSVRSTA
jgi:tRNA(fMet)-specific endonuclease VapC